MKWAHFEHRADFDVLVWGTLVAELLSSADLLEEVAVLCITLP